MTDSKLRIGIAGAGHFGRYHALKVAASSRARLAGIHDPDLERAKTVVGRPGPTIWHSRHCWMRPMR